MLLISVWHLSCHNLAPGCEALFLTYCQVIALICYLMETKNDRGPFLVVVPSSVLPGWDSELNFWARGVKKIVYAGPAEERRRLFK